MKAYRSQERSKRFYEYTNIPHIYLNDNGIWNYSLPRNRRFDKKTDLPLFNFVCRLNEYT